MLLWFGASLLAISATNAVRIRSEKLTPTNRIVGGHDAPKNKYTYTASIEEGGYQICTASILCDKYLLTAAHCCQDSPEDFYAVVGSHNRSEGGVKHQIEKWIPHEEYGGLGAGHLLNDICIGVLADPVVFNRHTTKTVLPLTPAAVADGTASTVMGWGYDDRNATHSPTWLQYDTGFTTYSSKYCADNNKGPNGSKTSDYVGKLCVIGKEGETVCMGDSGGPIVKVANENDVQIGVFSYYYGNCGTPYPDIYTNVSHYVSWIKSHVEDPTCLKFASLE